MKTTLLSVGAATLAGCTLPTIDVGTKEPIKIDPVEIKIDVNVYQHSGEAPAAEEQEKEQAAVIERLRNRMAEIQTLKSNLAVGENHLGLLVVRDIPAGYEAKYVKDTVDAENADRSFLMTDKSNATGEALAALDALGLAGGALEVLEVFVNFMVTC